MHSKLNTKTQPIFFFIKAGVLLIRYFFHTWAKGLLLSQPKTKILQFIDRPGGPH